MGSGRRFGTGAAEETDHPREVVEAALAYVVGNQTEAAYARSDLFERRRPLMDEWASYLASSSTSIQARATTTVVRVARVEVRELA